MSGIVDYGSITDAVNDGVYSTGDIPSRTDRVFRDIRLCFESRLSGLSTDFSNIIYENTQFDLSTLDKDENGVSILYSTDATYHFGMYAYQCTNPAGENGICKNCNKGRRLRVCIEKGHTPFGLYSDQNPSKFFTRVSKNKKEKHHYYLHDFGDIPQKHSQYISNEPVEQKNTKKTKKSYPSVSNFDDLYQNVDWNQ